MLNLIPAPSAPILRALHPDDLPMLLDIQRACYGDAFIESGDVYLRRLASAANCSLVYERDGQVYAYLAAYRSSYGKITPLHGDFQVPDDMANTLYLHDMAVHPACAGQGLAQALLESLWTQGRLSGLRHTALVSVQDSLDFWARRGYVVQPLRDAGQRARLATYGEGAVYMARPLDTATLT
ncbi:GNAT family N-acetyltransferase [Pseudoduganella sp. SL102]|uniref:GNAT family N-acetyltransferase n=1 Tax=Pseudoduganella sp. SL102 TaxID=2995154 RepID=UPI00248BE67D|nr:GNAT family N-acetyltransferase [Pseudoduganella sp. SL102]WBS00515.1 GNAT family N-acetyltransferase [Pseudoduganella sp. SL102]